jgi:DNA-binding MarR family transcriptional regulator
VTMTASSAEGRSTSLQEEGAYGDLFGRVNLAIIRLGRAHRALAAQLMREVGLRPEQGAMMMHLWAVGPVRQTSLSREFGKDSAATTRTVQRMEQAGFVRRRPDPTDGRATLVEPTAAGNVLRPQVERLWQQLERDVLDLVGEAERSSTAALLGRLADGLSARLEEPPHPVLDPI